MSLPIHIGQMEIVGEGRVVVTEVEYRRDTHEHQDHYNRTVAVRYGELRGTITLEFWGNIFAESSQASNHVGIPLTPPPAEPPAPLATLFKPFQRRISA